MKTAVTVLGYVFAVLFLLACVAAVWLFVPLRRRIRDGTPEPTPEPDGPTWDEWVDGAVAVAAQDAELADDAAQRVAELVQVGAAWVHRACRDNRTNAFPEWICADCAPVLVVTTQRRDREST